MNTSIIRKTIKKLLISIVIMSSLTACAQPGSRVVEPGEFVEYIETTPGAVLLDVRTPEEFSAGHIAGATNIDYNASDFLEKAQAAIPTDVPLALYCRSGRRSAEAAKLLIARGYQVTDLGGGILAWQEDRLPLTAGDADSYITPSGTPLTIRPLVHASLRITFGETEIEIDPVGKLGDLTTDYTQLPKADYILVTHEHHDHLDPQTIKEISGPQTQLIANSNSAEILGYGTVMHNGDTLRLKEDIKIEAVPAYNTTPAHLQFHPKGRDNGYVLTLGGLRVYIAGDTEVIPEMKDLKDIDIAFLPCNQPYTMTPEQLIEAAETIRPKVVYPYHFGTTDLSTITPALGKDSIYVRLCPFETQH